MAKEIQNLVLQWITMIAAVILLVGSVTWFAAPTVPTAKEIAAQVQIPESEIDLTGLATSEEVQELKDKVLEEDLKEQAAKELALAELTEKDNKAIFKFLNANGYVVDDRDDIKEVVVKKARVDAADYEEGDYTVYHEIKVKFYDSDQDKNIRVYLDVETEIDNNEVEDQEISLA